MKLLSVMFVVAGRGRMRFAYPTLRKEREGWGTRTLVVAGKRNKRPLMGLHGAPVQSWLSERVDHPERNRRSRHYASL